MAGVPRNEERAARIANEAIADAYGPEEQAIGWYTYLDERLHFPFSAACIAERRTSPLRVGQEVEIVGMATEEECEHEMFVLTPWDGRALAIPLAQLEGVAVDDETERAIGDWHYGASTEYAW